MGQLQDAFSDAAGEVANIKAQPSNRYWWLYGTIKAKNENGTLDVAIDGVTIQQVKATVSCMMASVGDRAIVLKAGPLMTCVDVIATSDNAKVPASSITGTLPVANGGTGATTAELARSSLGVEQSPLLVNNYFYGNGNKYFLIAKSELPTNENSCAGHVRVRADFGGWEAGNRTTVDVTVHLRYLEVSVAQCSLPNNRKSLLQVRQDPSGYVWVYLWMSEEYYYASVRVDGEQFERLGTWGEEPSGDTKWTSDMSQRYAWRKQLYAGVRVGRGLKFQDGILSVDNGA